MMKHTYRNGAIFLEGQAHEEAIYHVSNEVLSAAFDGKGMLAYYAAAGEEPVTARFGFAVFVDGMAADICASKTVTMLGRRQTVLWQLGERFSLEIDQFLDVSLRGVLISYRILGEMGSHTVEVSVMHTRFACGKAEQGASGCVLLGDKITYAADRALDYVPENQAVYFTLDAAAPSVSTYLVPGEGMAEHDALAVIGDFGALAARSRNEVEEISVPASLTERERAMFYSTWFCSFENFKVKGDYRAFMAGYRYLLPMRSYYRDSYFTVLPMYHGHTDKVRDQLLTLAGGIGADGSCPSAVRSDFTEWWGDHFDSPSYLAMMLYDYVRFTNDTVVMDEIVGNATLLDRATRAVTRLGDRADETGLLKKPGDYNKCDWADEVNRNGYVTYNEALYYRAMVSLSRLYAMRGETDVSEMWQARADRVKRAINEILWDEELGYYINFKQGDHTERNLSIDTVFTVLFGIADEARAKSVLSRMEALLESTNNPALAGMGDFGTACVYPLYGGVRSAYYKSARPYDYHNGANWPYLTAMYALAKRKHGMAWREILGSWFEYNTSRGNYTPVEYFSPVCPDGSLLQAWCGDVAFVLDEALSEHFWD